MAHAIDQKLDYHFSKITGQEAILCNERCKFWRFPNSDRPCVLSDVFSVLRGEPCCKFVDKDKKEMTEGSG